MARMSEYETIRLEPDGPIGIVTLSRPAALNAVDGRMRAELPRALARVADDETLKVVLLRGAGRAFSAGADLKEDLRQLDITRILVDEYKPSFDLITGMDKPVMSAVSGSAAGISLALALACDLTIMADDAFLLSPFSTIGLIPDGGSTFLLVRQMGYRRAYAMAIEAERIDATTALETGLVNKVVASATLQDSALTWAKQIAARAPLALAHTKRVMRFAAAHSYEETFLEEARAQKLCLDSDDFLEGHEAFLAKRKPSFRGH